MKKLYVILLFLILGLMLHSCKYAPLSKQMKQDKQSAAPLRFTLVAPLAQNPYWDTIREGMEAANKKLGVDTKYVAPTQINPNEQLDDLETAIASKVDGIITTAYNTKQFTPMINKAVEAGIPVVLIDNDAPRSKRTLYIGASNVKAGIKAGELMSKATVGRAAIGIMTAASDQTNLSDRVEGFQRAISKYPGMRIVSLKNGNSDSLQITEKLQEMLKEHPEITGIFCTGGYGSIIAAKMLEQRRNHVRITLIGFYSREDTIRNIENGVVYGSIVQNAGEIGYLGVKTLKELKDGKKFTTRIIDPGMLVVTRKNLDTYKKDENAKSYTEAGMGTGS